MTLPIEITCGVMCLFYFYVFSCSVLSTFRHNKSSVFVVFTSPVFVGIYGVSHHDQLFTQEAVDDKNDEFDDEVIQAQVFSLF